MKFQSKYCRIKKENSESGPVKKSQPSNYHFARLMHEETMRLIQSIKNKEKKKASHTENTTSPSV